MIRARYGSGSSGPWSANFYFTVPEAPTVTPSPAPTNTPRPLVQLQEVVEPTVVATPTVVEWQPPEPQTVNFGLTASAGAGNIMLSWDLPDIEVTVFDVYRGVDTSGSGPERFSKIGTVPGDERHLYR